ncbi:MAG: hypothetical protein MRY74_06765 [Neomegalonema sp.]|nr:hypothetical protein [Neomegalonema sp.]
MRYDEISPDFRRVHEFFSEFNVQSFSDGERVSEYLNHFSLDKICANYQPAAPGDTASLTAPPDYERLCRLHFILLSRKPFCTLAFGSGYETAVIAAALQLLQEHFGDWAATQTPGRPVFHLHAVEESEKRAANALARLDERLKSCVTISVSSVRLAEHDCRPVTFYDQLPDVTPDLLYIDGPTTKAADGTIGGLSLSAAGRHPMSADPLRMEFLFEPGALIMIEGRSANARLLRAYLRRAWSYAFDAQSDAHFFELSEDPYDPANRIKLDFCIGGDWLLD